MLVKESQNGTDVQDSNEAKRRPLMQAIGNTTTQKPRQRTAVVALGLIFILGGIVGLFIPILPGGALIFAGALMISPQSNWLRRALEKLRLRFPFIERSFKRFSAWGESWQRLFRSNPGGS
jgi:hypothetical protein